MGLVDHLHLFLRVVVFEKNIDLRKGVEKDLTGLFLGFDRITPGKGRGLRHQFRNGAAAGARKYFVEQGWLKP